LERKGFFNSPLKIDELAPSFLLKIESLANGFLNTLLSFERELLKIDEVAVGPKIDVEVEAPKIEGFPLFVLPLLFPEPFPVVSVCWIIFFKSSGFVLSEKSDNPPDDWFPPKMVGLSFIFLKSVMEELISLELNNLFPSVCLFLLSKVLLPLPNNNEFASGANKEVFPKGFRLLSSLVKRLFIFFFLFPF
jgi:hypothetical protein